MLLSVVLEGVVKGLFSSIIPGVHPILLSFSSELSSSIAYGVYIALSNVQSVFLGAFSAGAVYVSIISLRMAVEGKGRFAVFLYVTGCIFGLLLSLLYFPISEILSIKLPRVFIFSILLLLSILFLMKNLDVETVFIVFLSSLFGFIVLKLPIPVRDPLQIAIAGLFGGSTVLLSAFFHKSLPLGSTSNISFYSVVYASIMGVLMGIFISYFPAISLSVIAFLLHPIFLPSKEEILVASGSASSAALLFSAKAKTFGLTRTSFAATLGKDVFIPRVVSGVSFGISLGVVITIFLLPVLYRMYTSKKLKFVALSIVFLLSFLRSGISGILLLLSSTALGILPHILGVEKRALMFFLLFPTLLYYTPM